MKVVLASKNPHKLVEIDAITRKLAIELILQSELRVDIDGVTAVAITKLDGTAKGGIVIAVSDALKVPLLYL